jgi:hypothetical protein
MTGGSFPSLFFLESACELNIRISDDCSVESPERLEKEAFATKSLVAGGHAGWPVSDAARLEMGSKEAAD